jgi:hypothetical protein
LISGTPKEELILLKSGDESLLIRSRGGSVEQLMSYKTSTLAVIEAHRLTDGTAKINLELSHPDLVDEYLRYGLKQLAANANGLPNLTISTSQALHALESLQKRYGRV